MRHRKAGKKLNRDIKHRKALFKNLINALIIHEEIKTTEPKAKAIKGIVDKLISRGKVGTLNARRTIAAFLQQKKSVNKVVDELGPRFKDRVSGFTRIIKVGKRKGDDAMVVKMELVQKQEKHEVENNSKQGKEQPLKDEKTNIKESVKNTPDKKDQSNPKKGK